jgi:hypothetical protein
LRCERGFKEITIYIYRHHLNEFAEYLVQAGITSLRELSPALLAAFIVGGGLCWRAARQGSAGWDSSTAIAANGEQSLNCLPQPRGQPQSEPGWNSHRKSLAYSRPSEPEGENSGHPIAVRTRAANLQIFVFDKARCPPSGSRRCARKTTAMLSA